MSLAEAYESPPSNEWVRPSARVVLVTLILIGVAGWVFGPGTIGFKIGMCAVTAVIEVWGFNAAVQWARALVRDDVGRPLAYWTLIVFACAGWTIFSLYHALDLIAGDMGAAATPAYVAFTCLALALPFHEWAIERVEVAPKKAVSTPVATRVETGVSNGRDSSLESSQTGVATGVETAPRRASRQQSRTVARELSRQFATGASKRRDGSETRVATRAPPLSEDDLKRAVSELTRDGKVVSIRSVAKHLDVPPSRVERSPAKHVLRHAA